MHFGPWFGLEFCLLVWRRLHLGSVKILNQDAALGRYADNLLAANAHRIHGEIARSTGFKEEWHACYLPLFVLLLSMLFDLRPSTAEGRDTVLLYFWVAPL